MSTTPAVTPVETPPVETPSEEKPAETPVEEKPTMSLEDALSEVAKTRGEAANYRTKLRDSEASLASAKTIEEVNEIVATMTSDRESAERLLLVENVALKHKLPEALAARLQGKTREELEADAVSLASLIPAVEQEEEPPAPRLKGGLTPAKSGSTETTDPGELARRHAPRR